MDGRTDLDYVVAVVDSSLPYSSLYKAMFLIFLLKVSTAISYKSLLLFYTETYI